MKLVDLLEAVDPSRPHQVQGITWYLGKRDRETVKQVFDPFQKKFAAEMKALKGKWNGIDRTYDFKTAEQAATAEAKVAEMRAEFQQLLKDYPEDRSDSSVSQFFKHQDKVDKSFGRK